MILCGENPYPTRFWVIYAPHGGLASLRVCASPPFFLPGENSQPRELASLPQENKKGETREYLRAR